MPTTRCSPNEKPDFKLIVDRAVAVFGVYTGATLSFYVKDFLFSPKNLAHFHGIWDWATYWGSWAVIAVVALLLRYIIGSAVHLNRTYVPKETQTVQGNFVIAPPDANTRQVNLTVSVEKAYQSTSLCWLFVDILFLIVFGILAFFITSSADIEQLMWRSIYFMAGGFVWSAVAWKWRTQDAVIATEWIWIDLVQTALTFILICISAAPIYKAVPLTLLYLVCLFADLYTLAKPR
jgi:hypothetical protein